MMNKNLARGFIFFLAGLLTASIVQFYQPGAKEALADQYSCIRTDLDAQGMTGNIPDPEFTITYNVPSCYGNNGYKVSRVYMYGNQVAVHYQSSVSQPASTVPNLRNIGGGGGGIQPIP